MPTCFYCRGSGQEQDPYDEGLIIQGGQYCQRCGGNGFVDVEEEEEEDDNTPVPAKWDNELPF